jgi:hypothetical protein
MPLLAFSLLPAWLWQHANRPPLPRLNQRHPLLRRLPNQLHLLNRRLLNQLHQLNQPHPPSQWLILNRWS